MSLPFTARPVGQWLCLAALSALLVAALEALNLPAAFLLGCMGGGILLSAGEGRAHVPKFLVAAAQSMVGCLIARSMQLDAAGEMLKEWPVLLALVAAVIAASSGLGWVLMRRQILPGTTAVWGMAPGAASAMTLMAESFGADVRLVAFMQYLRVVLVTVVASTVARIWVKPVVAVAPAIEWFPPVAWGALAATLLLALSSVAIARRWRIPAGPLLVPLVLGVVLQNAGVMKIELPPVLLAASYALIGWSIGLRFTRAILRHALRALPQVLASILLLMAICAGFAVLLHLFADVDPLTAYLATSPGGADSVAIIAASSRVDLPFVMAMQTSRFLVVVLIGPALSRWIAETGRNE